MCCVIWRETRAACSHKTCAFTAVFDGGFDFNGGHAAAMGYPNIAIFVPMEFIVDDFRIPNSHENRKKQVEIPSSIKKPRRYKLACIPGAYLQNILTSPETKSSIQTIRGRLVSGKRARQSDGELWLCGGGIYPILICIHIY